MTALQSVDADRVMIPAARAEKRPRATARWVRVVGAVFTGVIAAVLGAAAIIGVRHSLAESRRSECRVHLERIGLAFHQYHEAHQHFPSPAITDPSGKPLLSWRVEILPHLGYRSLYERFHRDEPWDSPHNLALLGEMPDEFACPDDPNWPAGQTRYLIVVGPPTGATSVNTPFEPGRGVDLREIIDGSSTTALAFEADRLVPWTKPDDLTWAADGPLPRITRRHGAGTHLLRADGSALIISAKTADLVLRGLLTINGGEVVGGG
jgi:hypothetical protein